MAQNTWAWVGAGAAGVIALIWFTRRRRAAPPPGVARIMVQGEPTIT